MTVGDSPSALDEAEFQQRWARAQALMDAHALDALLVSNMANVGYLTGHAPAIAVSPTRPWYVFLPRAGAPTAIVPSIGLSDFVADCPFVSTENWASPDLEHGRSEGVDILVRQIASLGLAKGRLGIERGPETRMGMALQDLDAIAERLPAFTFADCSGVMAALRGRKSRGEVAAVKAAADAVGATFASLPALFADLRSSGAPVLESALHRALKICLLEKGVDDVPYLIVSSGAGGYPSLTRRPTRRALGAGDVIGIDVGARIDGYWSDFNRNFAVGHVPAEAAVAYEAVTRGLDAGLATVRPGLSCSALWTAMAGAMGEAASTIGRFGHGVGLDLTEPPSIHPHDETCIETGMVLAIEPSITYRTANGEAALMVREELVEVTADSARLLTQRAPDELPILSA